MNPKASGGSPAQSKGANGRHASSTGATPNEASDGEDLDESGLSDDDENDEEEDEDDHEDEHEEDDEEEDTPRAPVAPPSPAPPSRTGATASIGGARRSGRGRAGGASGNAGGRSGHASNERVKETEGESSEDEEDEEDEDEDEDEDQEEDNEEDEEEEDSSDVDVGDCEKKRDEFIDDLTDLEKQFAILREQLYRERITQIEIKLNDVRASQAAEYLQPLEELQENLRNRLEVGQVLKELRLANIQCKFDAEMLATDQNYESEKGLLLDSIKAELEDKIHRLEEDKQNVDLSSGLWERSGKSRKRKADPMDPDRRKKPVTVTGPYIVYMLTEDDILEDWTAIKKSLTQRKKTTV